jgi:hypothetical protein
MGGGRQLSSALTFQQHRVRESLNLGDIHSGRLGDLLDGCARPDPSLNILGPQHAFDLTISSGLAQPRPVAAYRGTQSVVYPNQEFVGGVATFADDVLSVDIESNESEFPHVDLLLPGI